MALQYESFDIFLPEREAAIVTKYRPTKGITTSDYGTAACRLISRVTAIGVRRNTRILRANAEPLPFPTLGVAAEPTDVLRSVSMPTQDVLSFAHDAERAGTSIEERARRSIIFLNYLKELRLQQLILNPMADGAAHTFRLVNNK